MPAWSAELPEYQVKAAFLYNFASFTSWPAEVGDTLNLCVYGQDPFGANLDALQDRKLGHRQLKVWRKKSLSRLYNCQIIFITRLASGNIPQVLKKLADKPILIIADTPGAGRQGVTLNMVKVEGRISFEANLRNSQPSGLRISAKLLSLATTVIQ